MLSSKQEHLFREWLAQHKGLMFRVVLAYTFTPEDADDLFQEVLLQVWRSVPSFRGESKSSTWVYKVALNTALAWNRKESKRRRTRGPLVEAGEVTTDPTNERNERVDRLYDVIRELPKADKSLILLHLDGLSYRQMAEILGITETNVGARLTRLRKRVAEAMEAERGL